MSRIEWRALRAFRVAVEAAVPAAISHSSQATRLPLQLTRRANIRVSMLLPNIREKFSTKLLSWIRGARALTRFCRSTQNHDQLFSIGHHYQP
jgi:hypothetical protein